MNILFQVTKSSKGMSIFSNASLSELLTINSQITNLINLKAKGVVNPNDIKTAIKREQTIKNVFSKPKQK